MSSAVLGVMGFIVVALGAGAYAYGFVIKPEGARWLDTLGLCCALFALALLSSSISQPVKDPRVDQIVMVLLSIVTLAQGRAALSRRRGGRREGDRTDKRPSPDAAD